MHLLTLLSLLAAPIIATTNTSTSTPITTTKITPSYWRATFSNPPLNLQDNAWLESFYAVVNDIVTDPDVKVVVFDSSAEHFFISHFDVINGARVELTDGYWANITALKNAPILTIAAVRGIARGGGAELVAALDVKFASREKAVLGQIEVGYGLLPGGGGMDLLPRLIGRSRALEIVLGADDFDADTAALYGWINRAIPDDKFEAFVDTFARRVAGWDHYAIAAAKNHINKRSQFPTADEQQESFNEFLTAFGQGAVAARVNATIKAGLQVNETFEINANTEVLKYVGDGPWNT